MTKYCPRCDTLLEATAFNFKVRATGRLQPYCRECSRRYVREHYVLHTAYYIAKARKRKSAVRDEMREWLLAFFREHPCVDCGETDPIVLQFDHRDPAVKVLAVSLLMKRGFAWSTIKAEIAKCDVRCANCHLRRTAQQFGWYRLARPTGVEPITLSSED